MGPTNKLSCHSAGDALNQKIRAFALGLPTCQNMRAPSPSYSQRPDHDLSLECTSPGPCAPTLNQVQTVQPRLSYPECP
ncbi:hypothetical protein AMTR_s00022p00218930 [Amborella trichopoda]|uniref:Uncharacterized protein n=1 Tax=Amborella trichopoda TaxID=13333 RepID=W1PWG0_AMBTC|nr:hypothetical protein AMTR_s00022p00218930 [Amborella trichopoda]